MIDPLAMPVFKPLWEAFPYLPGCFAAWRGMSLGEISASAYAAADGERRPSDAIVDCMAKHAARSLGNDVGEAVKRYFSRNSAVLSANLHGIDCLPEMVQAVPFFGLDRLAGGTPGAVIPVLSCGGVSLQSSAYPRGLQSFHADAPARFPLFRSSWQDTVELNAPALAAKDVRSSAAHWRPTRAYEERGLGTVLHHLLDPDTLALKRFGEQAARVNAKLYAALFPDARPVVAYLELEEIARELLIGDLARPDSVLHRALFTPVLREGFYGVWPACAAVGLRGFRRRAAPDSRERHGLFLGRRRARAAAPSAPVAGQRRVRISGLPSAACAGSRHRSPARPEHLSGAVRFLHDACT